jgi:hypothetical protein
MNRGGATMERENSPAYRVLSPSARRALDAIEQAIALAGGGAVQISRGNFHVEYGLRSGSYRGVIRQLASLGMVDVERGAPRRVNVFRLSTRWRGISEDEARRLRALARPPTPKRRPQRAVGVSAFAG